MERCRWCGASVSPKEAICPSCGTRLRRESSTCPSCKKEIRSGLVVCPHCGEELLRRRIPWKLIGGFGGMVAAVAVVYLVLTMVPLPFGLPFVAAAPTATPTEVILPPTPTATATEQPPTATATATATFTPVVTETATSTAAVTPVITATATITASATAAVTTTQSPGPTETPPAAATERPGFLYAAPVLLAPGDESDLPAEGPFNFTEGAIIELSWEPVGLLGEDQWYSVSLVFTNADGQPKVNWCKETAFVVPSGYHDEVGSDREVYWSVTVVSGTPGAGESRAISPPSETWMFRWG